PGPPGPDVRETGRRAAGVADPERGRRRGVRPAAVVRPAAPADAPAGGRGRPPLRRQAAHGRADPAVDLRRRQRRGGRCGAGRGDAAPGGGRVEGAGTGDRAVAGGRAVTGAGRGGGRRGGRGGGRLSARG